MKKILATLCMIFAAFNIFSQQYQRAGTLPISPVLNDSISIVDSALTFDSGFILYSSQVDIVEQNIKITNCYIDPTGFGSIWYINDTIKIGLLPLGSYNCTLYSRYKLDTPVDCNILTNRDSFTFTFTVSQYPAGISEIDDSHFAISPNPATDKLTINTSLLNVDVDVLDMSGREYIIPYSQREIDISSLAAGVYCLRIQNKEGSITRRFIKQ